MIDEKIGKDEDCGESESLVEPASQPDSRQDACFGPFPLSYTSLADDDRLDTLTIITESVEKRTPFEMASSQEIAKEDREFISKLMQLDPRAVQYLRLRRRR